MRHLAAEMVQQWEVPFVGSSLEVRSKEKQRKSTANINCRGIVSISKAPKKLLQDVLYTEYMRVRTEKSKHLHKRVRLHEAFLSDSSETPQGGLRLTCQQITKLEPRDSL